MLSRSESWGSCSSNAVAAEVEINAGGDGREEFARDAVGVIASGSVSGVVEACLLSGTWADKALTNGSGEVFGAVEKGLDMSRTLDHCYRGLEQRGQIIR